MEQTLVISEIFKSIQGETSRVGLPCTFVRTFGCNLDCAWCDTLYARTGEGTCMAVADVLRRVVAFGGRLTCITGGGPMLQPEGVCQLAERLMAGGQTVLLETNGTLDLAPVPPGVIIIMDVKCPGSGHTDVTLPSNLARLGPHDEVKFVIQDRADYDWAVAFIRSTICSPARKSCSRPSTAGWRIAHWRNGSWSRDSTCASRSSSTACSGPRPTVASEQGRPPLALASCLCHNRVLPFRRSPCPPCLRGERKRSNR